MQVNFWRCFLTLHNFNFLGCFCTIIRLRAVCIIQKRCVNFSSMFSFKIIFCTSYVSYPFYFPFLYFYILKQKLYMLSFNFFLPQSSWFFSRLNRVISIKFVLDWVCVCVFNCLMVFLVLFQLKHFFYFYYFFFILFFDHIFLCHNPMKRFVCMRYFFRLELPVYACHAFRSKKISKWKALKMDKCIT